MKLYFAKRTISRSLRLGPVTITAHKVVSRMDTYRLMIRSHRMLGMVGVSSFNGLKFFALTDLFGGRKISAGRN